MSFSFKREQADKYLAIARMLYEKIPLPHIERELNTSGKIIGMVRRLMESKYITVDPATHEASWTAPLEEVEAFLDELHWQKTGKRLHPPTVSAAEAVENVIKTETAKEATERASQYLQIGKVVAEAYWKWAQKMGIPLEEAVKHDIGNVVKEALDYHARGRKLEKRIVELEDALRMALKMVDPIVRLEKACNLVAKFLIADALYDMAGFDIEPIVPHYNKIINEYMKGGYSW